MIEAFEHGKRYACPAVFFNYFETGQPAFSTYAFVKTAAKQDGTAGKQISIFGSAEPTTRGWRFSFRSCLTHLDFFSIDTVIRFISSQTSKPYHGGLPVEIHLNEKDSRAAEINIFKVTEFTSGAVRHYYLSLSYLTKLIS